MADFRRHARTSSYRLRCSGRSSKRVDAGESLVRRRAAARGFSFRKRHNRHGIYTNPPHPGHREGGPDVSAGASSDAPGSTSPSRRLPEAIAATEPRLTPISAAILRWLCVFMSKSRWISATTFGAIIVRSQYLRMLLATSL